MTNAEFKPFYNAIENANTKNDNVWYAGYMWMNMTKLQGAKVMKVLDTKGCVTQVIRGDGIWYQIPSGLLIKRI